MPDIFKGLKVIDAASYLAGPGAATLLGDFGAEVIKVEPIAGDGYRLLHGKYPVDYNWLLTSRNKKGLALDLRATEGRQALLSLCQDADVLLFNLRVDQLQQLELSYEAIKAINPRIIYAHFSGYGVQGPDANRKAFDATAWFARTAVLDIMRDKDETPPMPAAGVGDHASAMTLFAGIVSALYRREREGVGSKITTSLSAVGTWANGMQVQGALAGYDLTALRDAKGWQNPFSRVYATGDGRHIMLALPDFWKQWPGLTRALGHPEWLDDERFTDARSLMRARMAVRDLIASAMLEFDAQTLSDRFDAEDLSFSLVQQLADVISDPQLRANDVIMGTQASDEDWQETIACPLKFDDESMRTPTRAPEKGEHSRSVLRDAGLSDAKIDELIAAGIVHQG